MLFRSGLTAKSGKAKFPTRRSKRTRGFKNLDSNSESEESEESPKLIITNSSTAVKELTDLYNEETETDSDDKVPGPSKATKSPNKGVIVSSSDSSGSETDFDGDVAMLPNTNTIKFKTETSHDQKQAASNIQANEKNNNLEGPSPPKQVKADDSDPLSKYDKDLLLEDL